MYNSVALAVSTVSPAPSAAAAVAAPLARVMFKSVTSNVVVLIDVVVPCTTKSPPTYRAPAIPTPPLTTSAPVVVFDEAVVAATTVLPLALSYTKDTAPARLLLLLYCSCLFDPPGTPLPSTKDKLVTPTVMGSGVINLNGLPPYVPAPMPVCMPALNLVPSLASNARDHVPLLPVPNVATV